MKRHHFVFLALVVLLTTTLRAAELTVFAGASLTDALRELAAGYESQSGDKLIFNFAGSNALARQIKEGAPADIFFSADAIQMDNLAEAGLIDPTTRTELLSNSLVIVVPKDGPAQLAPAGLTEGTIKRLALADPQSVPAGVYAREYLTKQGLWQAVESKVVPTENVRAALAAVESGNVDAGIVYKTDAAISKEVKIACEVPTTEGPRIVYPVAAVRETRNAAASKRFLAYLKSEPALAIFRKFGFIVLPKRLLKDLRMPRCRQFWEDREEASAGRRQGATDKLGNIAKAENWPRPEGHEFFGASGRVWAPSTHGRRSSISAHQGMLFRPSTDICPKELMRDMRGFFNSLLSAFS